MKKCPCGRLHNSESQTYCSRCRKNTDAVAARKADLLPKLVKLTSRKPLHLEELCDKLDVAPARVRVLLAEAKAKHLAIELAGGLVGVGVSPPPAVTDTRISPVKGKRQVIGCISDTHLGSKYCLRSQLQDCIHYFYEQGARVITHSGDILDGCYAHGEFEMSHMGIDEQTRDLFETLPKLPGLTYHAIGGNHDGTFMAKTGVDVPAFISAYFRARGRKDFFAYGNRGAMLKVCGALLYMWHPGGSIGYAVSYKMQKKIEGFAPGSKPQLLQIGHWHKMASVDTRGVFAFAAGTFQGAGSAFGLSLTDGPCAIGGTLLSFDLTKDGTLRDIVYAPRRYFELEQPLSLGAR